MHLAGGFLFKLLFIMNNITLGIPTNTRLREDVQPILEEAIGLREGKMGRLTSDLKDCDIVSLKISDMIRLLLEDVIQLALISDDKGIESVAACEEGNPQIYPQFSIAVSDPPQMKMLARKEEAEEIERLMFAGGAGIDRAFTSYPETLRRVMAEPLFEIRALDGQVESFLRNELFEGPAIAYDLVRSGGTADKYELVPICENLLGSDLKLPSVWSCKRGYGSGGQANYKALELEAKISLCAEIFTSYYGACR
jgi:ATP phosphoribosyltransferase